MDISLDTLAQPLQVVLLEDASFGSDAPQGRREPHRHDYHELIWTRRGEGEHSIDGEAFAVHPGTVTLIGRGQVHVFERARRLSGAVVRFGPELQPEGPGWLVGGRGSLSVAVPPSEVPNLEATIAMLAAETARPPDARGLDLQRHLLSILLLWVERWYEGARTEHRDADDPALQLYRRFAEVLERDFARHQEAGHYADALAVPAAALAKTLGRLTGRTTKELILDRVMLEAARLLRFTDLTIGQIAHRVGFDDQLYFSRAFKRQAGEAPQAYRDRVRGEVHRSAR